MSNERKELGKITHATFGLGGYQDVQIGFWLTMGGDSWGVSAGEGAWSLERDKYCKWTEEDRAASVAKAAMLLSATLKQAKKHAVQDLVGTPIEATFDGMVLKSWRVLTEVL